MRPENMMIEVDRLEREATYRTRMAVADSEYHRAIASGVIWVMAVLSVVLVLGMGGML